MTQPDDVTSLDAATRDAHAEIARLHEEALTNIGEQTGGEENESAGDPGWFGDEGQQSAPDGDQDGADQEHDGKPHSRRAGRAWPDDDGDP